MSVEMTINCTIQYGNKKVKFEFDGAARYCPIYSANSFSDGIENLCEKIPTENDVYLHNICDGDYQLSYNGYAIYNKGIRLKELSSVFDEDMETGDMYLTENNDGCRSSKLVKRFSLEKPSWFKPDDGYYSHTGLILSNATEFIYLKFEAEGFTDEEFAEFFDLFARVFNSYDIDDYSFELKNE